jgi:hypothetical protein
MDTAIPSVHASCCTEVRRTNRRTTSPSWNKLISVGTMVISSDQLPRDVRHAGHRKQHTTYVGHKFSLFHQDFFQSSYPSAKCNSEVFFPTWMSGPTVFCDLSLLSGNPCICSHVQVCLVAIFLNRTGQNILIFHSYRFTCLFHSVIRHLFIFCTGVYTG